MTQNADKELEPVRLLFEMTREDNPLVNAPHTVFEVTADNWSHEYSREVAAFPSTGSRERKFWPSVSRIDNVWGDRNLFCSCPPMEEVTQA